MGGYDAHAIYVLINKDGSWDEENWTACIQKLIITASTKLDPDYRTMRNNAISAESTKFSISREDWGDFGNLLSNEFRSIHSK